MRLSDRRGTNLVKGQTYSMTKSPKTQWGGPRENAGRKAGIPTGPYKSPEEKAITVSLSMPGDLHRKLAARSESEGLTVNDAIREAIAAWVKQRRKK